MQGEGPGVLPFGHPDLFGQTLLEEGLEGRGGWKGRHGGPGERRLWAQERERFVPTSLSKQTWFGEPRWVPKERGMFSSYPMEMYLGPSRKTQILPGAEVGFNRF